MIKTSADGRICCYRQGQKGADLKRRLIREQWTERVVHKSLLHVAQAVTRCETE
jgi:hypothetical protein